MSRATGRSSAPLSVRNSMGSPWTGSQFKVHPTSRKPETNLSVCSPIHASELSWPRWSKLCANALKDGTPLAWMDSEVERFTFGFTIRDSPDFFINVSAWGNQGYINSLADNFRIGDCVTVENPLVSSKDPEKDKFCPATPSHYRLLVVEPHSQVLLCTDTDTVDGLLPLMHLPAKDSVDFYSLGDIMANGQKLDGAVINILAAVKTIGEPKQFTTSDGRRGQRMEVKLFDDSVSSFPLVCWDKESIQLLQTLIPREADSREASLLFSYAKQMSESGALDHDEADDPAVDSITDVYTVNQLKLKAKEQPDTFFGLTYSFISKLDLDSSISKVIKTRCCKCKFQAAADMRSCSNQLCPGREQPFSGSTAFDLLVDVTDHTGTLQACSLRGAAAEQTLGCSTDEFIRLSDDQRTALKWKLLLERCKICLKILPSARRKSGIRTVILTCSLADPGEVKQHMSAVLQQL
ncbi:Meiosis-specific with OB domain-containing protein [Oryzias melastigma]|uniref:Meiosis-specific with OB domain-containing protein n=1 Tax=Oryzias melastigma TaxID=30732 RepID=A0A834C9L6_ORYME|nr:Meiosis-specific with OB domain-containing protein [Oryzias melastigma]